MDLFYGNHSVICSVSGTGGLSQSLVFAVDSFGFLWFEGIVDLNVARMFSYVLAQHRDCDYKSTKAFPTFMDFMDLLYTTV